MRPDFIIIGTMKGGTTSLHYYLGLHPGISMSSPKELNFFIHERNWHRGTAWYESHFRGKGKIHGEASPNYSAHPRFTGAPENMHAVVPDAKLIYVLRDPIERMLAHYVHVRSDALENRPLPESLLEEKSNAYVARSCYHMQLQRFLPYYPRERILILSSADLLHQRQATLRKIFRFLDVEETFNSPRFRATHHHSADKRLRSPLGRFLFRSPIKMRLDRLSPSLAYHLGYLLSWPFSRSVPLPELDPEMRNLLVARIQDDVERLREWSGLRFEEWSC